VSTERPEGEDGRTVQGWSRATLAQTSRWAVSIDPVETSHTSSPSVFRGTAALPSSTKAPHPASVALTPQSTLWPLTGAGQMENFRGWTETQK